MPVIPCMDELVCRVDIVMIDAVRKRDHASFGQSPAKAPSHNRHEAVSEQLLDIVFAFRVIDSWEVIAVTCLREGVVDQCIFILKLFPVVEDVFL